ncbi:MAG: thiamine pyrophosphate-dependent enzyme [Cyclobacteriaceae bacterium]|nr:thiamine pyrophosphate-dependent enzyme [Cyclobacteriaceae bacterium]
MFGLKHDIACDIPDKYYSLEDYEKAVPRWCPGCGDHAVLTNIQKLCREKQLDPAKTVFVSGIGCSSRFPHYMKTYGFHGLHGRAFPVASGIKFRRPDLDVFVITGDGDCCSIGAGAWMHAIRYNINMTVMLFNNEIYGLTKNQTSPTSRIGTKSNTSPRGSILPPINPLQTTLGISNVSFVAQTVDWNPAHLYATLNAAHEHKGFSFVHIVQRCPVFQPDLVDEFKSGKDAFYLIKNNDGIVLDENAEKTFKNSVEHDHTDINAARNLAEDENGKFYLGLLYQNKDADCYDDYGAHNMGFTAEQKMEVLNEELDKRAI